MKPHFRLQLRLGLAVALVAFPPGAALKLDLQRQCPGDCAGLAQTMGGWTGVCQQAACAVCAECTAPVAAPAPAAPAPAEPAAAPPPPATTAAPTETTPANCAAGWTPLGASCYVAAPSASDQPTAKDWCEAQGAKLVSISTAEENEFVRSICGSASCWIGLTEKVGTGDKATPQAQQQWIWADGTGAAYSNWKKWPQPFEEPNNWGGSPMLHDERFAHMNAGKESGANYEGFWYDCEPSYQAKAVCEIPSGQVPAAAPASPCPVGWTDFDNKCYIADEAPKDWHAAEAWCKFQEADLVSINSAAENEEVRQLCGPRMCWLGLSEKGGTGDASTPQQNQQWIWNDGTNPSTYSNWKEWGPPYSEPNNWGGATPMSVDERKAYINFPQAGWKGKWYDTVASTMANGICEKPMVTP